MDASAVTYEQLARLQGEDYLASEPLPAAKLRELLAVMTGRWVHDDFPTATGLDIVCNNFGLTLPESSAAWPEFYAAVRAAFDEEQRRIVTLAKLMQQAGMVSLDDPDSGEHTNDALDIKKALCQSERVLKHGTEAVLYLSTFKAHMDKEWSCSVAETSEVRHESTQFDDNDLTSFQSVVLYVLKHLERAQYRRFDDFCYREIVTPAGERSHAWVQEVSIEQYIVNLIQKNKTYDMWKKLTVPAENHEKVTKHLAKFVNDEFPPLDANRYMWAFSDGIYAGDQDMFYPYELRSAWGRIADDEAARRQPFVDQYARVGRKMTLAKPRAPTRRDAAVKYFDMPFGAWEYGFGDASLIPTPEFDKILDGQKFDAATKKWFYTMIGRLLYEIGLLDGWQVVMFLKGIAGSGKSTVARYVASVFPRERVGVFSSNAEKQFGLEVLADKLLSICYEVKSGFNVSQGDFQSMISGEDTSIARKNKTALIIKWICTMLLCGNELADWADAAGSMARRLMVFEFNHKPERTDHSLFDKLEGEKGRFIRKCNVLYLSASSQFGSDDIWGRSCTGQPILPPALLNFWMNMQRSVNLLQAFLHDEDSPYERVASSDDAYVLMDRFIEDYQNYRKKNGHKPVAFTADHYLAVFSDKEMKVAVDTREWGDKHVTAKFITGIQLKAGVNM